jgi:PncC family amidohydrolase
MPFPDFSDLRFEDILNQSRIDAHTSGYELLKTLDGMSSWEGDRPQVFRVATAESLTAGMIFSTLVDIPFGGSYKYGAFAVYDTDAKRVMLGVKVKDVYTHRCAKEMAVGILRNSNASVAIAVTGNAMPIQNLGAFEEAQKLGEVFIGVACYNKQNEIVVTTHVHNFCAEGTPGHRICKLWIDTVIGETYLKEYIDECERIASNSRFKNKEKFKRFLDGRNDFVITSMVSNYIRNMTAHHAFQDAIAFLRTNKSVLSVPSFVQPLDKSVIDAMSEDTNNKTLKRNQLNVKCTRSPICDNDDRISKNTDKASWPVNISNGGRKLRNRRKISKK